MRPPFAGRRSTLLALVSAATTLALPAVAYGRTHRILLGRSADGRPIVAYEVGDRHSTRRELVVGCVHGNEDAGVAIARRLIATAPRGLDLWILPVLNPDGRAAHTRTNARGVDLNRNFPWRWRQLEGTFDSGPRPLSEPESRIAYRLIRRLRPRVSIWFHQHMDVVDTSGGDTSVERRFASVARLPLARLPREPGSAVGWENHRLKGATAFVVELPAGSLAAASVDRYARAVLAAGRAAGGG